MNRKKCAAKLKYFFILHQTTQCEHSFESSRRMDFNEWLHHWV